MPQVAALEGRTSFTGNVESNGAAIQPAVASGWPVFLIGRHRPGGCASVIVQLHRGHAARAVHKDVHGAALVAHPAEEAVDLPAVVHGGGHGPGLTTRRPDLLGDVVEQRRPSPDEDQSGALGGEPVRRRPADATARSGRRTTWPSSGRRLDRCIRSPSTAATMIGAAADPQGDVFRHVERWPWLIGIWR